MKLEMIKSGSYKGIKDGSEVSMTNIHPTCSNWALHLDEKAFYDVLVVDRSEFKKTIIINFEEFELHNYDILVFCDYPHNTYVEVYRLNTD